MPTVSDSSASPAALDVFHGPIHLSVFNRLPWPAAVDLARACLDVPRWWTTLLHARPFNDYETLLEVARDSAFPFTPAELEAAVVHHLRQRRPADARPRNRTGAGLVEAGPPAAWAGLAEEYERRFGRPFIVRAAGRSMAEIGGLLETRLAHSVQAEEAVVANQLRQIALLALANRISE